MANYDISPTDGKIAGYARIDGRDIALVVNDFTVKGASTSATNSKKMQRTLDVILNSCYFIQDLNSKLEVSESRLKLLSYDCNFWMSHQKFSPIIEITEAPLKNQRLSEICSLPDAYTPSPSGYDPSQPAEQSTICRVGD